MKKVTDIHKPLFLRVRETFLDLDPETTSWATLDFPKSSHVSANLIIDIYKKDSPSHPDRHIGWWLWRWEGLQTTLKAGITRDSDGAVSVAIPELGEFVDCWVNEDLQKEQTNETLLVHCVLRDSKTSSMLFMESLYLFQDTSLLQSHLADLENLRGLLTENKPSIPACWPSKKRVALVTDTFVPNSGVGRFLVGIYGLLNGNDIACEIYASTPSPAWRGVVKRTTELFFEKRPEDIVLLYNHSIYDVTLPLLQALACPKVLYFHNITPPEHYAAFDAEYARSCEYGLDQLGKLSGFSHFLANSAYSAQALTDALSPEHEACDAIVPQGPVSVGVAPPMVLPSGVCDGTSSESDLPLPPENKALLFVGRIAPHKRIEDLISLFHEYHKLQKDAALIIAGQEDRDTYMQYLNYQLQKLPVSLRKHIYFYKNIDDAGLAKLYRHASAFVCMSEHEGFCIPLVEAMSFNLPTFAYAQPAVAETLAGSGVLFHHKDFGAIARTLHRVLESEDFLEHVLAGQRLRLDHLRKQASGALILQTLEEAYLYDAGRL